jgi:hypothetical protein
VRVYIQGEARKHDDNTQLIANHSFAWPRDNVIPAWLGAAHDILAEVLKLAALVLRAFKRLLELLFARLKALLHAENEHPDLLDVRDRVRILSAWRRCGRRGEGRRRV